MIRYLRLSNWRAYDALELEFEPGTTFIVAPNGVGKTSLILALAWGVFGDQRAVSGYDSIRAGASSTEVEVHIELADGRTMSVVRRCSSRNRGESTFTVGGAVIDESEAQAGLEGSFGVELEIAAQLAMMLGGGHLASEKALDLKDHLYKAFGVADLLQAAAHAAAVSKAATKEREAFRVAARQRLGNRSEIEIQMQELGARVESEMSTRGMLESELGAAQDQQRLLASWEAREKRSREREAALAALEDQVSELIGDTDHDSIGDKVREVRIETENHVQALTDRLTEARSHELAANHALELLRATHGATCPTCLRPFHGDELGTAETQQDETAIEAAANARQLENDLAEVRTRLKRLGDLERAISQLPPIPEMPSQTQPDVESVNARVVAATEALRTHDTSIGRLEAERDSLRRSLVDDDVQERDDAKLLALYRSEAVAAAAADALGDAAAQATSHRIDPLVNEVQWRWKQLFGREGLQLRPDGSIVLMTGERELPWSSLSGGERIWARLVTHLLLLSASTRMQFAWFDEPLEHLDPRARRAVAAALATASGAGGPKQIIVTTYEYAIAQQLAADLTSTSVMRVRRSEEPRLPSDDYPIAKSHRRERKDPDGGRESSVA